VEGVTLVFCYECHEVVSLRLCESEVRGG
jgi:hypothetical protein